MREGRNAGYKWRKGGSKRLVRREGKDETLLIEGLDILKKGGKMQVGLRSGARCRPDRHFLTSIYN